MDEDLMAAIDALAEEAEDARPATFDLKAMAGELSERFGSVSIKDIASKIKEVFRSRGLTMNENL
jgi:ribosomal protein L9